MQNKDRIYLFAYYVLKILVKICPNFILDFLVFIVAKITFLCNTKHRKIIDVNLKLCFEEKSQEARKELAFKIYHNFAKFGLECIKNQNTNKKNILKKIKFENEEFIQQALKDKRAIIFVTAHYGNWELISLAYAAKFGGISIVARTLDSKPMDKILSKNRTQFNIELIDKRGGLRKMLKALREKRALGMLTDQEAQKNESMELEFFGKKVNFLVGASVIAKKTEALIIPAFIYQNQDKLYTIKIFEPLDSRFHSKEELTIYQAKCCEEMIRFKPDEYFFFHKRFKSFYSKAYEE